MSLRLHRLCKFHYHNHDNYKVKNQGEENQASDFHANNGFYHFGDGDFTGGKNNGARISACKYSKYGQLICQVI